MGFDFGYYRNIALSRENFWGVERDREKLKLYVAATIGDYRGFTSGE